jgi:hypothetical protein
MSASKRIGWLAQYFVAKNQTNSADTSSDPEAHAYEKSKAMRKLIDKVEHSLS